MSIKSLKKFNPQKFNEYPNEEIRSVETLCLKLLNYKLNYMTCYDYLVILVSKYELKKKIIDYSYEILYKIITGDIKKYIFKSPLKIAKEAISLAKQKFNENGYNNNESNIKNNNNNFTNNSCNMINRTSSLYHKISKYINVNNNDKNNKNKYLNNYNNYIINNNTISTNSSSINKIKVMGRYNSPVF